MILFILGFILILVGAYFLAQHHVVDAGYVLIAYAGHAIELSFWWALLLTFVSAIILYYTIRLIKHLFSTTTYLKKFSADRRQKSTQASLTKGLFAYFSGDWNGAQKIFLKAAKKSSTPELNYLSAAYSNLMLGNFDTAQMALEKIENANDKVRALAINLCKAEIQYEQDAFQSCIKSCQKIIADYPQNTMAQRLLIDSYVALEDWVSLEPMLPKLIKQKLIFDDELAFYQQQIVLKKIIKEANTGAEGIKKVWASLSKHDKHSEIVVAEYTKQLIRLAQHDEAASVLADRLNSSWSSRLAVLYGRIKSAQPSKQLKQINSWLKKQPEDASLLLSAGRVALMNELWGKAKSYFEASIAIEAQSEAYAELARLQLALGELESGAENMQQGLLKMDSGLPDLPLPQSAQD